MKTWVRCPRQVGQEFAYFVFSVASLQGGGREHLELTHSEDTCANPSSAFTGCLTLSKFLDLLECCFHLARRLVPNHPQPLFNDCANELCYKGSPYTETGMQIRRLGLRENSDREEGHAVSLEKKEAQGPYPPPVPGIPGQPALPTHPPYISPCHTT